MNEPLTFTAGQHYTTRDGREARVYATDGANPYEIHGAIKHHEGWKTKCWTTKGHYTTWENDGINDLIGPWIEKPVVNWAAMPAWAEWVAMDEGGQWYWFNKEPSISRSCFESVGGMCDMIHSKWNPTYTGDWRSSKVQRPQA